MASKKTIPQIEVLDVIENDNGTADISFNIQEEALKILISKALNDIIIDSIDKDCHSFYNKN